MGEKNKKGCMRMDGIEIRNLVLAKLIEGN